MPRSMGARPCGRCDAWCSCNLGSTRMCVCTHPAALLGRPTEQPGGPVMGQAEAEGEACEAWRCPLLGFPLFGLPGGHRPPTALGPSACHGMRGEAWHADARGMRTCGLPPLAWPPMMMMMVAAEASLCNTVRRWLRLAAWSVCGAAGCLRDTKERNAGWMPAVMCLLCLGVVLLLDHTMATSTATPHAVQQGAGRQCSRRCRKQPLVHAGAATATATAAAHLQQQLPACLWPAITFCCLLLSLVHAPRPPQWTTTGPGRTPPAQKPPAARAHTRRPHKRWTFPTKQLVAACPHACTHATTSSTPSPPRPPMLNHSGPRATPRAAAAASGGVASSRRRLMTLKGV